MKHSIPALLSLLISFNAFADFQLECATDVNGASYLLENLITEREVAEDPEQTVSKSKELGPFTIGATVCDDDSPYLLLELSRIDAPKLVTRTMLPNLGQTLYLELTSGKWIGCTLQRI